MGFWEWVWGSKGRDRDTPSWTPPQALVLEPAAPAEPPRPRFAIDDAIELIRSLPLDEDADLVLRVVRKTLRSTGIALEELISAAESREKEHAENIAKDVAAIEQLERDIAARKAHMSELTAKLDETKSVRERLEEAIEAETKVGASMPSSDPATPSVPSAIPKPPVPVKSAFPKPPVPVSNRSIKPAPPAVPSVDDGPPSEPTVKKASAPPNTLD